MFNKWLKTKTGPWKKCRSFIHFVTCKNQLTLGLGLEDKFLPRFKIHIVFPGENVQNKYGSRLGSGLLITTTSFDLLLTILLGTELVDTGYFAPA